ncbi:serine hydrolase domain-containing protein [Kribbella sp. NPDC051587]|uniref:serine hydrolase domain-containing protein n=1 Tax=Kribbella sp. NPDC051587 TaxID=3364119 RepID=UPI0037B64F5E
MKVLAIVLAVLLTIGGWIVRPHRPGLEESRTGDASLQRFIDDQYDEPGHRLSIAVVTANTIRYAGRGAGEGDVFEVGSISKALTGLLLADAVKRGEVTLDQQVGTLLPLGDSEVASATLEELATHTSGLPNISRQPTVMIGTFFTNLRAANPYKFTVDDLLSQARAASTKGRGTTTYSNLGGALLGQALARKAGKSYQDLVQERVFTPYGMSTARVATGRADAAPPGYSSGGRRQSPWIQDGYAPAGGVVASAEDLAHLAQKLLAGAGIEALSPRRDYKEYRIGLFWITEKLPDRSIVWHDGGTGGYASFIGLDLERKRAVVMLSDVQASVDDVAIDLLKGDQ